MRIVLLYFILSGLIHTTTAQQNVRYDTSVLHVRGFSSKSLSEYEHNREFQYSSVREPPHSLWDRFVEWMNYWESRLFMSLGQGKFISWLATLIAIAVIVFFIVRVSGMGDGSLFKKKSPQGLPYTVGYEDIHAIDFGEAIRLAIEQRNFRLAVRLLYLQSLKNLTDKEKINWQINKTNREYLRELNGSALHGDFVYLTTAFENNWYGNIPVGESEFGALRQSFTDFNHQLN